MKIVFNMKRKFSRALFAFAALNLVAGTAIETEARERPNIIFIMADDLGHGDLGCYGQQLIKTPNIDQLAAGGMRFTQAYAGGPVCTPSRSVLMTGLHNGHTPARDNIPHYHSYLGEEDITVAEILRQAGYATGGMGKWSLGDAGTEGRATNQGFDTWIGYLNQDHAHYYYPEYLDLDDGILELTGNTLKRDQYSHDILTNGALNFIREKATGPFFLYLAYTLPHFASTLEDEHGFTVPSAAPYENTSWPVAAKKYAAMVSKLDKDVGRILELLKALGIDEKTLVIFTSDNGGHSTVWEQFDTNGPYRGFKRDLTEGGIRVPFIATWPGKISPGTENHHIIAFQDMMPTFADLANTSPPAEIDGISVLPTLLGKNQQKQHEYLYWDYGHCRERYDQAVRMGKWKGIRLGVNGRIELYDLEKDIGEVNNIADKHPQIVHEIEEIMKNAAVSDKRYEIGNIYRGGPIWKKEDHFQQEK
jgi:arylsulfatase A-like enzyme